jgi:hypothetical protein
VRGALTAAQLRAVHNKVGEMEERFPNDMHTMDSLRTLLATEERLEVPEELVREVLVELHDATEGKGRGSRGKGKGAAVDGPQIHFQNDPDTPFFTVSSS